MPRYVKALANMSGLITKDRTYTVIEEGANKSVVIIIDDRGERCIYSVSRFEELLTPEGSPDFCQMQQIAANVNITGSNELAKCDSCDEPVEAAHYKKCKACWWSQDPRNAALVTSSTAHQPTITVPLTADYREGDLLTQLSARRESALEDSDANLAALLSRASDRIAEIEKEVARLKITLTRHNPFLNEYDDDGDL